MIFANKSILLISPEPWSHIFVSKHHYATHLAARGNTVYFLNPPSNQSFQIAPTEYENVTTIDYNGFIKGLRFLPGIVQRKLILQKFNQLQKLCKTTFDVVWSFDNSVFYDFKALPNSVLKISHIVDLNQDFETAKAAATADICFGPSQLIVKHLKKYNSNSYFINHGYNVFSNQDGEILPGINKMKVVYAGNLGMSYLDWHFVLNAVKSNEHIDFIFVGPNANNFDITKNPTNSFKKECHAYGNAFFVGKVDSNVLKGYYQSADVLLVSYLEEHHQDQANPHKMMEYLGSGTVIVATKTQEYDVLSKGGLIAMSEKNHELLQLFNDVVLNIEHWNGGEKRQARMTYALDNTYEKQLERIESLVHENV